MNEPHYFRPKAFFCCFLQHLCTLKLHASVRTKWNTDLAVCIFFLLRLCVRVHIYVQGIGIVKWDYNGTLGSAVGVRVRVCVRAHVWVCGWAGRRCRRETWIGSALILAAQCHTRCNATPTLPHSVFEQAHTYTHTHTMKSLCHSLTCIILFSFSFFQRICKLDETPV